MSDSFFKTRKEIEAWLDKMYIHRYTIHDDLTVDVAGDVNLSSKNLAHIPVQFGAVSGSFWCNDNRLTSLVGTPRTCGNFACGGNQLTNLVGSPRECHNFWCNNNQIVSLEGSPTSCNVFWCGHNFLALLNGSPDVCDEFHCDANQLTTLDGVPKVCRLIECNGNPDLYDISGSPYGCIVVYDHDVVAKNRAAKQLATLKIETALSNVVLKSGRML